MTVGDRLKALRNKIGMSQVDFADKINVSKQTLYKYENNIITNIPSDKIEAAAQLGNVSPAYLMGWEQSENKILQLYEKKLLNSFSLLNTENKKKSIAYTENLLSAQKMEDELLAAHARTDITPTAEGQQHDLDLMNDNDWEE